MSNAVSGIGSESRQGGLTREGVPRQRALRQDAIRNERALIQAVGELLKESPDEATMPAVADRAGLSLATAYRYFPTLDLLHRRFMLSVVEGAVETTATFEEQGQALFERILRHWIEVVKVFGPAMVRVRSREGFLTRFAEGEGQATALDRMWGEAIRGLMAEVGVPPERYALALTLYNTLLNSREILDLRQSAGFDDADLVAHLTRVYRAALGGLV